MMFNLMWLFFSSRKIWISAFLSPRRSLSPWSLVTALFLFRSFLCPLAFRCWNLLGLRNFTQSFSWKRRFDWLFRSVLGLALIVAAAICGSFVLLASEVVPLSWGFSQCQLKWLLYIFQAIFAWAKNVWYWFKRTNSVLASLIGKFLFTL